MSAFLRCIGLGWLIAGLVNLGYFASISHIEPISLAFALLAPATGAVIYSLGLWLKRTGVTYSDLRGIQEGLIAMGGVLLCLGVVMAVAPVVTLAMKWIRSSQDDNTVMSGIVQFIYPILGIAAALPGMLVFGLVGLHVARRKRQPR